MCCLTALKCCEKWGFLLKVLTASLLALVPLGRGSAVPILPWPLLQGHVQKLLAPSANPLFFGGLDILGGWWLLPAWFVMLIASFRHDSTHLLSQETGVLD